MNDVIIIGAGPAGTNTAYRLSSLGYDVTVVDWRQEIGDKLCTGIVGSECLQRFPADSSLIYREARSARVVTPSGKAIDVARPETQAYVVNRVGYVASFAEKARQRGANYLLGHRVTGIYPNGETTSVQVSVGDEQRTLKCKAIVIASGFGSELTSQLGLQKVRDMVTGVQGEVLAPHVDRIHIYFGKDVAPGFFAWLAPTTEGKALIGLLSRRHGSDLLEQLILKLQSEGIINEVTKAPSKWGIPLRPLSRTFGNRLLVVGDAAGQVKPTTGGGIYYALLASETAAETLHEAFSKQDLSANQLKTYQAKWKSLLSRELEIGYSARRLFEVLPDHQIDSLMQSVASNGLHSELVESRAVAFDWHSGFIMKMLNHPVLSKALNFVNPVLASITPKP